MRVAAALVTAVLAMPLLLAQAGAPPVRAMWVQRATLTSATSILSLIDTAGSAGFNTLIVQVRGRGDAYYASRREPRAAALANQPAAFDPLEILLGAAHRAGLKVHAWVNVNLVSDASPPTDPEHLVRKHPEWLMVPRPLAAELGEMDPKRPEYLARLSEYALARKDRIEGLFLSPMPDGSVEHTVDVVDDIASRYAVDGVHLDYIRYPNDEFDYSAAALDQFRRDVSSSVSDDERRDYEQRAAGRPLFYTDMFPQRWQQFRRDRVTDLLTRIRSTVKARRPQATLSAAVFPDATDAHTRRFQSWGEWLQRGLLDVVCPMAYTSDHAVFRRQIAQVEQLAGSRPVWAGIGAFQLPPEGAVENIRMARELGAEGIVLFSYDNLTLDYVSQVTREAFAR